MNAPWESVLAQLPRFREAAEGLREAVLANLVLLGETRAPTFHEQERVEILVRRFAESGLQSCSTDEMLNGFGILPGEPGERHILLVTNVDTLAEDEGEPSIEIHEGHAVGPFVGDNSLALACLATLPDLLDRLKVRLRSNLILMGAARTLGRGNLEGLRFFLSRSALPVRVGLCVESVQLGRLNHVCLGMARGDITVRLPDDYDWSRFGGTGAIIPLSEIISRISQVPLPQRPLSRIVMGAVRGGISHQNIAREARLSLEVRSESVDILNQTRQRIEEIGQEVAARSGVGVRVDFFAHREPGAIEVNHPLVRCARDVLQGLGLQPAMYATTSALSALLAAGIPSITVGCTTGRRQGTLEEIEEQVDLAPISAGLAQLAALVLALDGGFCDAAQ